MSQFKYDILIKNGTVIDGTGEPRYLADIAVKTNKIAAIGPGLSDDCATSVIDADNMIVCPGFIDAHCHTDWAILDEPWNDRQERQGVTTQVGGVCGTSPTDLAKHFKQVSEQGLGTNYALFAGHGSIRKEIIGDENRKPNADELKQMKLLLKRSMKEGALGLSTGLIYKPGVYSDTEELIEMVKVIAPFQGIYATHMRSESERIEEALEEAFTIAKATNVHLQISHIKIIGPHNWGIASKIIKRIHQEQADGLKITADQYPYAITGGGLYTLARLVKDYDSKTGFETFEKQYEDNALRKEMAEYATEIITKLGGPEYVFIIKASQNKHIGIFLNEAASTVSQNIGEFIIDEIYNTQGQFAMVYHSLSEKEIRQFMKQPWVMVGSDGVPNAFHPRTHGTFPRYLGRYVRKQQVLGLEEAIKKITALPADTFNFENRGQLVVGAIADIVVFDPNKVIDKSNMVEHTLRPVGIEHVIVNGVPVIVHEERTEAMPGQVLRRS